MSANSKPKLRLVSARETIEKPQEFDPCAVEQRITRAELAPTADARQAAAGLVLEDAKLMLRLVAVMGGEIVGFRQKIKAL